MQLKYHQNASGIFLAKNIIWHEAWIQEIKKKGARWHLFDRLRRPGGEYINIEPFDMQLYLCFLFFYLNLLFFYFFYIFFFITTNAVIGVNKSRDLFQPIWVDFDRNGSRWKASRTLALRWKTSGLKPKLTRHNLTFHRGAFVRGLFTCCRKLFSLVFRI